MATTTGPRSWVPPRFGTPRNPERETLGPQVVEVADRLGKPLMPHQRHVHDVGLEVDPETGRLAYDEVVLSIMRQQGKTWGCYSKMVWRASVASHRWGPQLITYTAQTRMKARERLEREIADQLRASERESGSFFEVRNAKGRPSRSTKQWRLAMNNGSEHLLFGRGNYLQIDAPVRKSGHGPPLDDGNIDEAWAHLDDTVEQAMRPAQATRDNAQLWVLSAAGDETSFYLWRKVLAGRANVKAARPSRVAYFEWSIPPEADIDDPDVWWEFMPALGRTVRPEFIRAELERARNDPDQGEDFWRRHYGNQWVRTPVLGDGDRQSPIPLEVWDAEPLLDARSVITGSMVLAVDVAPDGASASIVVVGRRPDGLPHIEVVVRDVGTHWLEARLTELREDWEPDRVVYDAGGPAAALGPEVHRAAGTVEVDRVKGRDYTASCEAFLVAVLGKRVRHLGQEWMSQAIAGAAKKYRGEGWLWDRQTALADITPLVAATVGLRSLEMLPVEPVDEDFALVV